ncbi:MAG TPA: ribonuclease III domain-containing protein [Lachnospiraceae bacterium]|jgi:ribonuclease III family protein|nr:ribonuclease III domain-containing protein [Lachnospiraceae bacterium]
MEQEQLLTYIKKQFELKEADINAYSPLTLAYIGDSIYDLVIKTIVVERANCAANKLHQQASALVKAQTQAQMADFLQDYMTEEEQAIYKRGRNAKSYTTAKNASVADYRKATGLEAVFGYLYLKGQSERVVDLVKTGLHNAETNK